MNTEEAANAIVQNLKDAGCNAETIACFMEELQTGKAADGLKLLAAHRKELLDALHRAQKRIDCLDYLVYQMQKDKK